MDFGYWAEQVSTNLKRRAEGRRFTVAMIIAIIVLMDHAHVMWSNLLPDIPLWARSCWLYMYNALLVLLSRLSCLLLLHCPRFVYS